MKHETSHHFRSHFLLGLLAIAVGVALLLERSGILEMGFVRHYWPFLLVLFGIGRIMRVSTSRNSDQRILAGFYRALVVYFPGAPLGPELRQYLANGYYLLWGEPHPEEPFQEV